MQLAASWKGCAPEAVQPAQRTWAKGMAYGLLYGKGAAAFAQELQCDIGTATKEMDTFRTALPGVDKWMQQVMVLLSVFRSAAGQ